MIKRSNIGEEFGYEDFLRLYDRPDAPALPLFVVAADGRVTVVAADETPRTDPGDTVIAMVTPEAVEGPAEAPSASAVAAAQRHGEAMDGLGQAAGAPIVTDALRQTASLAADHGGGAKPSGAGGGDVALAFFADRAGAGSFRKALLRTELALLPLRMDADGVRIDEPPLADQD